MLLFIVGIVIQLLAGSVPAGSVPSFVWAIAALAYVYLLVVLYVVSDKHAWIRRLMDGRARVEALVAMLLMVLLFGLVPQDPQAAGPLAALGFTRMSASWPFCLLLLHLLSCMGLALLDDLGHIRSRNLAAAMSHLSVFLVLVAGFFGSPAKEQVTVHAYVGRPVQSGIDRDGNPYKLPFAVTLDEFWIDRYQPKLYIDGSEDFLEVSAAGDSAVVGGWMLKVEEYGDMMFPDDSCGFRPLMHVGAEPAVRLQAVNPGSGASAGGWVSCGSFIFDPVVLELPDGAVVHMPGLLPKRFESDITVVDGKSSGRKFEVAVNHPARLGAWRIYQSDYDAQKGRWSDLSVLMCVYDPWFPLIRLGLWMMLLSAVIMFATAGVRSWRKTSNKEDGR